MHWALAGNGDADVAAMAGIRRRLHDELEEPLIYIVNRARLEVADRIVRRVETVAGALRPVPSTRSSPTARQ